MRLFCASKRTMHRSMGCFKKSIPWNCRSKGWKFRSMGSFQQKIGPDLRHIVAKSGLFGIPAAEPRVDVAENQRFLFFAHLRAREQSLENNRFSVLKSRGADNQPGSRRAEKRLRQVWNVRRGLRHTARQAPPIGGELSITAGEPKANLRKGSI